MNSTFKGNVFCAPETGHVFVIAGKTIDGANRYERSIACFVYLLRNLQLTPPKCSLDISLKAGNVDDADIPLHLSVRFDEDAIVRNTRLSGAWGDEERDENRHPFTVACPLVAGDRFKVYIFVGDSRFHIAINDAAFCTYAFRMPVQHILAVDVQHDLQTITQMDQRATFPAPLPLVQMGDGGDDGSGGRMEFSNDVPRRFSAGSSTKNAL